MEQLNDNERAIVAKLTQLGLPEGQAIKSAQALEKGAPQPSSKPACIYVMMKIKDDADKNALKDAFKDYANASKAALGKMIAGHGWDDEKGELTCVEIYNSPAAMDCHIGTCFEFYVKMLNHMTMTEIIANVDPNDVEFWKESASAWGATKFAVNASI